MKKTNWILNEMDGMRAPPCGMVRRRQNRYFCVATKTPRNGNDVREIAGMASRAYN
jgi:hypothetical protein